MAFTPTDPTKAEVRIVGTAPNQQLDFYIPRGAKGEPGGITLGTDLGTLNLNDVKTSGVYRLPATTSGLLLRNFPRDSDTGVLVVYERVAAGVTLFQEWRSLLQQGRGVYVRTNDNGTWSSWKFMSTSRVDQTAGRVIYQWDDLNGREQLIYGDTGIRRINPLNTANSTGNMDFRRVGQTVEVAIDALYAAANGTLSLPALMPAGFRPAKNGISFMGRVNSAPNWPPRRVTFGTNGDVSFADVASFGTEQLVVTATYLTSDTWPTTLPGTAQGTVPNS